jgi:hypothetical protein
MMITCPWCGTSYAVFRSNCANCGGPLLAAPDSSKQEEKGEALSAPPLPPRPISGGFVWRLLLIDGWAIAAAVFALLGVIFAPLGVGLTVAVVTAFIGIPFAILGIGFLGLAVGVLVWRYREAATTVQVLREGDAVRGQILGVVENPSVSYNGRHPWEIDYEFRAGGETHRGRVRTLNPPGVRLQPGSETFVLYLPGDPVRNALYPHP